MTAPRSIMGREFKVMLLIDSARAYERALLSGIARYSQLHGPWIFFHKPPFFESQRRKSLLAEMMTVQGIILIECSYLPQIVKLGVPVVASTCISGCIRGVANIVSDHRAIGHMAADHLIERGFRNFAFCGYGDYFWSKQRCEGFERRLQRAGCEVLKYTPPGAHKRVPWQKEQQALREWLRSLPKPVGLMACIDERSRQIAEACKAAGLQVPDEVAIIGVDNDEIICNLSNIPLSSVALTAERGGYEAAELLDKLMHGHKHPGGPIEIKPSHVVTRVSTDIMAVGDSNVSRAARFIKNRCREPLHVSEVAKAAGLSRRVLEKRFRTALDRSISEHIRRCRVDLIMELLSDSKKSISEIALLTGFSDAAHIARYFRGQTGVSLAEYRRAHSPHYPCG